MWILHVWKDVHTTWSYLTKISCTYVKRDVSESLLPFDSQRVLSLTKTRKSLLLGTKVSFRTGLGYWKLVFLGLSGFTYKFYINWIKSLKFLPTHLFFSYHKSWSFWQGITGNIIKRPINLNLKVSNIPKETPFYTQKVTITMIDMSNLQT